jgi:hypothetical protein
LLAVELLFRTREEPGCKTTALVLVVPLLRKDPVAVWAVRVPNKSIWPVPSGVLIPPVWMMAALLFTMVVPPE